MNIIENIIRQDLFILFMPGSCIQSRDNPFKWMQSVPFMTIPIDDIPCPVSMAITKVVKAEVVKGALHDIRI